jgi:hypothetical protein
VVGGIFYGALVGHLTLMLVAAAVAHLRRLSDDP